MKPDSIFLDQVFAESGGGRTCAKCKGPALRSLCQKHLRYAAKRWRQHAAYSKRNGLCCRCMHQATRADGRKLVYCKLHREINRVRCLTWEAAHREENLAAVRGRKLAGICANSAKHGVAASGSVQCEACRRQGRKQRRRLRAAAAKKGICTNALSHGAAAPGYTVCKECLKRRHQFGRDAYEKMMSDRNCKNGESHGKVATGKKSA